MKRGALCATLLFVGCAGDFPPSGFDPYLSADPAPGQEEATEIVWRQTYGRAAPPPAVYWRRDHLDCGNGWLLENGLCVGGVYVRDTPDGLFGANISSWHAEIAWPAWMSRIAQSAFAHELCHAAFEDREHVGACQPGENDPIAVANRALP